MRNATVGFNEIESKGKIKRFCQINSWFFEKIIILSGMYAAKSLQSCPTLLDPIDSSPPGSAVPGFPQAKTLEWVPFPSPMHESEK